MPVTNLASGSIDPDVKIPAAVRAAAARSEDIHKQAYQTQVEDPPADPPAEPQVTPQVTAPVEPQPAPTPAQTVDWEHRYNSMKGRYDRANDRITNLERTITAMTTTGVEPTKPALVPVELRADSFIITPKEVEDYGEEFLSVVGKKAKQELIPEVTALKEEVNNLKSQLSNVGKKVENNSRSSLVDYLTKNCPTWQELNHDDDFLDWLGLPDAYSGAIRQELLNAAFERQDAPRVVAFFNGFLSERAATAPAREEPDPAPAPQNAGKVPLETFAAPGRAKTAAPATVPTEKPIITRAQIARFYADSAAGKYRGKDQEKERLEREIFLATQEGRIQ